MNFKFAFTFLYVLAAGIGLSGCVSTIHEPVPGQSLEVPDRYSVETVETGPAEIETTAGGWWLSLDSPELNRIINDALENNPDVRAQEAKVLQERSKLKKEEAAFFPDLNFSFGGDRTDTRVKKSGRSATSDGSHSWDASLSSSYTPDIWGELTEQKKAVLMEALAAEQDLEATRIDTVSQTIQTWMDVIGTRNQIRVIDQQIKINQTLLELQKLRFSKGQISGLDVSQQRKTLAEAESQKPLLERQEQLAVNTLIFLTRKSTDGVIQVITPHLPDSLPFPQVGIPADLLTDRPDIRAAQLRLVSAGHDINAAKADMMPSLTLSAQALFSSGKLDLLFQNWVASLAASLAGPIFDGGLRKAEVERVRAAAVEQAERYAKTVFNALKEVEDALISLKKQADYIYLLDQELSLARLTMKDAMLQYRNGQSSYLAYLTAWTSAERLERQLVEERVSGLKLHVQLQAALGKPVYFETADLRTDQATDKSLE